MCTVQFLPTTPLDLCNILFVFNIKDILVLKEQKIYFSLQAYLFNIPKMQYNNYQLLKTCYENQFKLKHYKVKYVKVI